MFSNLINHIIIGKFYKLIKEKKNENKFTENFLECWSVLVYFSGYYPAKYIEEKKKAVLYAAEHKKEFKEYIKEKYGKEILIKNINCKVDTDIDFITNKMSCKASDILTGEILWDGKTETVTYCPPAV